MQQPSGFDPMGYLQVAGELAAAGDLLYHFKELRVAADYELVPPDPDKRDWVKNWTRAQRFIQRLLSEIQNI